MFSSSVFRGPVRIFAILTLLAAASALADETTDGDLFAARIAPLIAQHCLECHDTGTKKGRLDLSQKDSAFAGGKHGKGIVAGKPGESALWKSVESDEMPEDRPPLSASDKELLRRWIENGATWTGGSIEPHVGSSGQVASVRVPQRLTVPEYIATVRASTGVDITDEAQRLLPRDGRADGFRNTAYHLGIDLDHVQAHARLAGLVAGRMDLPAFMARFDHKEMPRDEQARRDLVQRMGRWLLRGPLDDGEVAAFMRITAAVKREGGDEVEAVRTIAQAMMQSPRFLYRLEGQDDPQPRPHELAARVSYILWGAPPDEELMSAAEAGKLATDAGLSAQATRMLRDPRARDRSAQFISEWLDLDRLADLSPDPKRYPKWNGELAADMRDETLAFFKEVVWEQRRPLSDLLNAQVTFATPRLAAHYGLAATPAARMADAPPKDDSLQALYLFSEGKGGVIRDASGRTDGVNLTITNQDGVKWHRDRLQLTGSAAILTETPPKRLMDAIKKSRALTLELWLTADSTDQKGPARILTLSGGPSARNFTLAQEGSQYVARLRTTRTSANGEPALDTAKGAVSGHLSHVIFTRHPSGRAVIYLDGQQVAVREVGGNFSNWDGGFQLAIGNETTGDRPWRGSIHRIAIHSRAFTEKDLEQAGGGLARYDLSSTPARGGLLTQGSVLTVGGDDASMVERGLFVLHDLLHSAVGNAPPGTDTTPVPTKGGLSQRAITEQRLARESCTHCHSKFEPLAFAFEKFDGIGAHHEKDRHGNALREDGSILLPGTEQPARFSSISEFTNILAGSERVRLTLTRKLVQFALGRPLAGADDAAIRALHAEAQKNGGTYAATMTAIVKSDLVRRNPVEPAPSKKLSQK